MFYINYLDVVYYYRRAADGLWNFRSTIPSPSTDRDYFGLSLAMDSRYAVISGESSTHLYKWMDNSWIHQSPIVGVTQSIFSVTLVNNLVMILSSPTLIDVYALSDTPDEV